MQKEETVQKGNRVLLFSGDCGDLGTPNIELKNFPDGEKYVRMPILPQCVGKEVTLVHRCYPEQDKSIIQLLLMISALKNAQAKKIIAIVPYLPYARQDKIKLEGETKSSETICSLIRGAGCDLLVTFDCHFIKKEGAVNYGGLPIDNITMKDPLLNYYLSTHPDALVAAPDKGATYMIVMHGGNSMKKVRGEYSDGATAVRPIETLEMEFEVKDRDVILVDDMIASGGTMIRAARECKMKGAKSVLCAATHGLFLGNALQEMLAAGASEVVVSDAIVSGVSRVPIKPFLAKYF